MAFNAPISNPVEVRSSYTPFVLTRAMHADSHRFKVIDCGRQFGKTEFGMAEVLKQLNQHGATTRTGGRALIVSPTYKLLYENWRTLMKHAKGAVQSPNLSDMRCFIPQHLVVNGQVWFSGQHEIEFRSADSEAGVGRGGRFHVVLFDEAARIPETVWTEEVRPALSESRGSAIFISTPLGRNWFYRLYQLAQEHPDYHAWRYSSLEGWQSRFGGESLRWSEALQEWDLLKATTPERVFQQEYLAEFLEQEGSLWNMGKAMRGELHGSMPGRTYVAGVDVAHVEDWMVTLVLEVETRQVVGLLRSRHHDWSMQKAKASSLLTQYPGVHVLIDSTGLGDPIAQDLREAGYDVEDIVFSAKSKKKLVENLTVGMEQGALGIPDQVETQWLLEECRSYQEIVHANGTSHYGAPEGLHDDGVTALLLAVWGIRFAWNANTDRLINRLADGMSMDESVRYGERIARWKAIFPMDDIPQHPNDLRFRMKEDWDDV